MIAGVFPSVPLTTPDIGTCKKNSYSSEDFLDTHKPTVHQIRGKRR